MNEEFRRHLQREFASRCEKNRRYSVRAFSQILQIHSSTLSQLLTGRRALTTETRRRLSRRLDLSPEQRARYEGLSHSEEPAMHQLQLDQFSLIADWCHDALLELIQTKSFRLDYTWMARRLGLTVGEVRFAMERLQRLELVEVLDGSVKCLHENTEIPLGVEFQSPAKRKLQKQLREKDIEAIEEVPRELRDHSSTTMAISVEDLPEARVLIRDFRRRLLSLMNKNKTKEEVYQLTVSFFPLTKKLEMKKKSSGPADRENEETLCEK